MRIAITIEVSCGEEQGYRTRTVWLGDWAIQYLDGNC